ncbi:MAG: DUF2723 domain-containing protein, partial [Kiritimatiellae bacterium]|nr:DUF2723 domain-containing protein [Kiritimatiellia bacterium]
MNNKPNKLFDWVLCVVLGVAGFVLFYSTLSVGPFPGLSARLISESAGLYPRLTPNHPLWSGLGWLLARVPFGELSFRLNLFSALCGAVSLSLLYNIVTTTVRVTIEKGIRDVLPSRVASRLAGISAVLFFAFCVPFWSACNRVSIASFDILLLLCLTRVFMVYAVSGKTIHALLFAFIYGVFTVEVSALIILSPVFGLYLLILLWRNEGFSVRSITAVVLSSFVGLLLYFLVAWIFFGSEGYGLRGYTNYWQVIWCLWRDQYWVLTRSMPRQGWLIVIVVTVVPWLTCIGVAKRGLNSEKDWSYYALHAVMTALVICVLLEVEWLAKLLKGGVVPVTPYLLTASVYGYLVAYWFLLPMNWHSYRSSSDSRGGLGRWLGLVIAIPALAVLLVVPFRNVERTDTRSAKGVNQYAEMIIDNLDGRTWLVTDGAIDDNLAIAGEKKGVEVQLVNLRGGRSSIYLKYISSRLSNIRLKNALDIGIVPMLQDWIEMDDNIENVLAMLAGQYVWLNSGMTIVPNKMLFFATKDPEGLDLDALLARHEEFWKEALQKIDTNTNDD